MKKVVGVLVTLSMIFSFFSPTYAHAEKLDEVNKWYPIGISKAPDKVDYTEGEKVDLTGLEVRFARYIEVSPGVWDLEYKDEDMKDYTIKYGWELMLPAKNVYNPVVDIKLRLVKPEEAKTIIEKLVDEPDLPDINNDVE